MRPTRTWWLIAIFIAATCLRLIAAFFFPIDPTADAAEYHDLGVSLVEGMGFTSPTGAAELFRPPVYPAFIAAVYWISGVDPAAVRFAQALVDLATLSILWWWVRRRLGASHALVVLILGAVSLSAIASVRVLLSECLATFFLTAAMALFDMNRYQWHNPAVYGIVGVLAGVLTLTRGIMIFLPLFLVGALLVGPIRTTVQWRPAIVLLLGYLLCLAPWLARNYYITGRPMLSTQGGGNLYAYHLEHPGVVYCNLPFDSVMERAQTLPAKQADSYYLSATWRSLRDNWKDALAFLPKKIFYFFVPLDWEIIGGRTLNVTYIVSAVLAMFGLSDLWRSNRVFVVHALIPLAYLVMMALIFYGSPRLRLPAEVFVTALAAHGYLLLRAKSRVSSSSGA